jgi:hypothetical protein
VAGALLACGGPESDGKHPPGATDGGKSGAGGDVSGGAGRSGGGATANDAGKSGAGGAAGGAGAGGSDGGAAAGRGGETGGAAGASAAGGSGAGGPVTGGTIINDRFWKDTAGTPIYSQGGGVLQVGDTYYWYGVKYGGAVTYTADPSGKNSDTSFQGVTTYSSKDLVNWKLEATDKLANAGGWFGRLGVAYNSTTKKYVLAAQGGGGLYFATSDKPNGGFVYDHVQNDLPGIVNGATGDQTIFQDDDGQAYLVSSSSSGRANRYVSPLRASDFLAAENAILVYKGNGREGNCMFKYGGSYYFCSSDLHGWNTSQTYCVSASNIKGPYGAEFVLEGTQSDYSHVTQTGFFFAVKGSQQTTVIFAGDRWSDFAGNGLGFNAWMPLSFSGTTPRFHSLSAWTLDPSTGVWAVAPENNWILNPTFEADRISVTTPVGWSAKGGANSKDGRTGNWSWQLTGEGSLSQTVKELPNGTYALSVWSKSGGTGAMLKIKNFGGSDKSVAIPASMSWTQVQITGINASGGHADVSITSGGQTVTVDDFVLTNG